MDDNFVMFEDIDDGDAGNQDAFEETEEEDEEGPDLGVLDLCLELFKLPANPLGL